MQNGILIQHISLLFLEDSNQINCQKYCFNKNTFVLFVESFILHYVKRIMQCNKKMLSNSCSFEFSLSIHHCYTLSHLENDRDVSAYSGWRRLSSRTQLVCYLTCSKRNTGIDALIHKGCVLQRVSLGAVSDVTVVLGMSIYTIKNKAAIILPFDLHCKEVAALFRACA